MTNATPPQDEERALAGVLDEIIPPSNDGSLPGAGELGLAPELLEREPALKLLVPPGLRALDELVEGGAAGLCNLSKQAKLDVLNQLATQEPGFIPALTFHTYIAYYQHERVVEALGLEARPPFPQGYDMEVGDLSLLDPVRQRGAMYRKT